MRRHSLTRGQFYGILLLLVLAVAGRLVYSCADSHDSKEVTETDAARRDSIIRHIEYVEARLQTFRRDSLRRDSLKKAAKARKDSVAKVKKQRKDKAPRGVRRPKERDYLSEPVSSQ